ncbi:MAG TPA: ADP-ribosylglycohydrolase family protein [Clostridia bacterium]|nr:ADP-ribosylglycohydrolase family protein [Clostridia bacterium]
MNTTWLSFYERLDIELIQCKEEGKDISGYKEKIIQLKGLDSREREIRAGILLDELAGLPIKGEHTYTEPSNIDEIKILRPHGPRRMEVQLSENEMHDKVLGAWLGRCSGCLLGQPIEGWKRERIIGLAKETNNYPFNYYISSDISTELREKYNISDEGSVYGSSNINWINNIEHMVEDDDTNYTIMGLSILEKYGLDFTPEDVAESWLNNLPILHTCTAERVAYQNIVNLIMPPESASYRNSYREWIGAQIRADFFGYITPGYPELGAELAWRDASISHIKNGIYGEMWVAAMLSAAAVTEDINQIIKIGLSEIPKTSRLTTSILDVLTWKSSGLAWEEAVDRVHDMYDESNGHDWCHTISNAIIVTLALIYGEKDFERTIGIANLAGFDTDCNGATVGSIIGMILGAKRLPEKWINPLNDMIKSGVDGFQKIAISELAKRTIPFARMTMDIS